MGKSTHPFVIFIIICLGIITLYFYNSIFSVPSNFPSRKNFVVNENESLKSISKRLEAEGYITSALLFRSGISFLHKDKDIHLGGYLFEDPHTLLEVIYKFAKGEPDAPLLSVTIPEGSTSVEVASLVYKSLPTISVDIFSQIISQYKADGMLFPSTYFLLPSYKEEDIVKLMLSTFTKKIDGVLTPTVIKKPLTSVNDVLTLASILEGEAKSKEDMEIVAGILLKRLEIGMPLQVDVALETYKQRGLPLKPINNPGLIAIKAALNPKASPYLYYITGNDGKMYYAKTFDVHKENIRKYLK